MSTHRSIRSQGSFAPVVLSYQRGSETLDQRTLGAQPADRAAFSDLTSAWRRRGPPGGERRPDDWIIASGGHLAKGQFQVKFGPFGWIQSPLTTRTRFAVRIERAGLAPHTEWCGNDREAAVAAAWRAAQELDAAIDEGSARVGVYDDQSGLLERVAGPATDLRRATPWNEVAVLVRGEACGTVSVPRDADHATALRLAKAVRKVQIRLVGRIIMESTYAPGRSLDLSVCDQEVRQ